MSELDETIERFARPRRGIEAAPVESDEVAGAWAFELLLAETAVALKRRGIEPVETVLVGRGAGGSEIFKGVAACWPLELFALTPRGVALPYTMLTRQEPGLPATISPRPDAPVVCVRPTPVVVGPGIGDVEVNRRGQLLWRWNESPEGQPWTSGFRSRFEANWSEHRPGPLVEPLGFAVVDHVDGRIERGVVH